MTEQPWKRHERDVATFFGVKRRLRGDDFSRRDVEVFVPLPRWEAVAGTERRKNSHDGLVVECKFRSSKSFRLIHKFRELDEKRPLPELVTIARWGPYYMSWMKNARKSMRVFDKVWDWLITFNPPASSFVRMFNHTIIKGSAPTYLDDWMKQAEDYCDKPPDSLTPEEAKVKDPKGIVAMRTNKIHGVLVAWRGPIGVDS